VTRELLVHDRERLVELRARGLEGLGRLLALEDVMEHELHHRAAEVGGLDADPLLGAGAIAHVAWQQRAARLVVDVAADGARLVELEVAIQQGGHLAERLARQVRLLLVLALGEVDHHQLVRCAGLEKGREDLARARAHRMSVDLHAHAPSTVAARPVRRGRAFHGAFRSA